MSFQSPILKYWKHENTEKYGYIVIVKFKRSILYRQLTSIYQWLWTPNLRLHCEQTAFSITISLISHVPLTCIRNHRYS